MYTSINFLYKETKIMFKKKSEDLSSILHERFNEYLLALESHIYYPIPPEGKRPSKHQISTYEKSIQSAANQYYSHLRDIFLWEFDILIALFSSYSFVIGSYHLKDLLTDSELYLSHRSLFIDYLVSLILDDIESKGYKLRTARSKHYLDHFGQADIQPENRRITWLHKTISLP